jgi:protein-arginine kinase activator protein McsA
MTGDELNLLLAGAVESEDYELASQIHEEIKRRKQLF